MMDHFSRASDCAGQVSICQARLLHVVRGVKKAAEEFLHLPVGVLSASLFGMFEVVSLDVGS